VRYDLPVRIAAALTIVMFLCGGAKTSLARACGDMPCCRHVDEVSTVRPARPGCCEIDAAATPELEILVAARGDESPPPAAVAPEVSVEAAVARTASPAPVARPPPRAIYATHMSRLL
jgi:hypothetical protein